MMTPSLRDLVSYTSNFLSQLPLFNSVFHNVSPYEPLSGAPFCPLDGPISCLNTTPVTGDSCCFVHPGGRVLLAQFWDQEVLASGAEEGWTLHGLWPDHCKGTYDQYCDMTPHYTNITAILKHYGQGELLGFMNRYWLAASGPNTHLWQHEFNKHASCINTLSPQCYSREYTPGLEVVDYFTRTAALFRTLDTYHALARAQIVPHTTRRYALADVRRALERYSGGRVVLRCEGPGEDVLHEAWYVYFLRGSLQTGLFVPAPVWEELGEWDGDAGNCREEVRYLPKQRRGES